MKVTAVIEIPKGDTRRRHLDEAKAGTDNWTLEDFIDLGPIKDRIPVNEGVMPIHYGFLKNTWNKDERDEIDVLVLSSRTFKPGDEIEIEPTQLIIREDGDHKVVASDATLVGTLDELPPHEREVVYSYFRYTSPIIEVLGKRETEAYIKQNQRGS